MSDHEEHVNHPKHYGGKDDPFEHVKVATAKGWHKDAFIYNCTKYLWRLGRKDGAPVLKDLRKAAWYLQRKIEDAERESGRGNQEGYDGHMRIGPHHQSCDTPLEDHDICQWRMEQK